MKKFRAIDVVNATGGELVLGMEEGLISQVSIDSREIKAGGLFFALKGERVDGHDFIGEAIEKGSSAIVFSKDIDLSFTEEGTSSVALIKVKDTERALQELAAWYLSQFNLHRIGVTGSTGKTTNKEMLFRILSEKYRVVCNKGNYNNLIGLPLSIFQVDQETEVSIFEMGMDRLGEIDRLAEIVKPHLAIITNIGYSHLSRLGSRDNILKAKMEICKHLNRGDSLIINSDSELLSDFRGKGAYKVVTVGSGEDVDFRISQVKDMGERGVAFKLKSKGDYRGNFTINVPGIHNCHNAGLAVAAASCLGLDMDTASKGLKKFVGTDKRLNIIKLGGIKIIDDSYNASPDSMEAAIGVLASTKGLRKIGIFGDMFELGCQEEKYHRQVGEYAFQKGIDVIISVGKNAKHISMAAREKGANAFHFTDKDMLISVLTQWIRQGDVILIKGSRGMAMDEIVKQLEKLRIE